MKILKRMCIIFISIYFICFSVYQHSMVVYASYGNHIYGETLYSDYQLAKKKGDVQDLISGLLDDLIAGGAFAASSLGAVVHGYDFEQFLKNYDSYKEYILTGKLEDDVIIYEDNSVSISADLMSIIKQALQEYSEETNGFWLMSTTSINALDPTCFTYRNNYISLQNLINNHGIIACQVGGYTSGSKNVYNDILAADFSEYLSPDYSFVCFNGTGYNPSTSNTSTLIGVYDSEWNNIKNINKYDFSDEIYTDISQGSKFRVGYDYFYVNYPRYNNGKLYICASSTNNNSQYYGMLISKDGCRIRVFKTLNAMKLYDSGKRSVYFGSDFYDKEPAEITITFDDLDKYINMDFDKYYDELKDTINSQGTNLSESELEKITDSLLGKLKDIDNNIGHVGDTVQESNNLLSQILNKLDNLDKNVASILENLDNKVSSTLDFSGIEERLDTIILSLGVISGQLDDMTAAEIETKTDNAIKEIQYEFTDIGELAKTKFPLSLPWDIFGMLKMLSGGAAGGGESAPETVSLLLDSETDTFVHTMSLYGDYGIVLYDSPDTSSSDISHGGGGHSRPGISSDSLHGGSGSSRWGAWLSDTGAPIFYIPVEFSQSMEIGGLLIIDLSGFEIIHDIGRIMFTIIFCMNLIHLTFKAVSAGKDLLTW